MDRSLSARGAVALLSAARLSCSQVAVAQRVDAATYLAVAKPGPGVLLFHQSNRTRKEWAGIAESLAAAADANETLAEAYLADGQKELAKQQAEKALALLDSHRLPASWWTDTEQYRGEIRRGAQHVLETVAADC